MVPPPAFSSPEVQWDFAGRPSEPLRFGFSSFEGSKIWGAVIIRIGFGGIEYYNYNKEP